MSKPTWPNTAGFSATSVFFCASCMFPREMKMSTILIVLLVLLLLGALGTLPTWGHSRSWGYGPSSGMGLLVLVLVVLLLMGRL